MNAFYRIFMPETLQMGRCSVVHAERYCSIYIRNEQNNLLWKNKNKSTKIPILQLLYKLFYTLEMAFAHAEN